MSDISASQTAEQKQPFFTPPSLPKGGGTLTGNAGSLTTGGPDGGAGWTIPLPVSAAPARSLAPQMALSYSNSGGNGVFGMGWQLALPAIRRRIQHGVPRYDDTDRFSGPGGDELLMMAGDVPSVRTETRLPFAGVDSGPWTVTRYHARSGGPATRTECWVAQGTGEGKPPHTFWIDYSPDGGLSLYGWSPEARLTDPEDPFRVAEWRIEETMTARGEHILWRWRAEDEAGCTPEEISLHPEVVNAYPDTVYWMNKTSSLSFFLPDMTLTDDKWQADWLAFLVFDYGERNTPEEIVPPVAATSPWSARPDPLSFRRYGFEVRTRRLCHEVLLWHRTAMMADDKSADSAPALISRLRLTYDASPLLTQLLSAQVLAYETKGTEDKSRKRRLLTTPPVEFSLTQPPEALPGAKSWQYQEAFDGISHRPWQMVDLFGDGIPGLLYRTGEAWWYRAPERDGAFPPLNAGLDGLFDAPQNDAITWGKPVALPRIPSLASAQLTDLDGDGLPELVVALPGIRGCFTLHPEGLWSGFKPFTACPAEITHPAALQVDLSGSGLTDLAMISPDGVRLWPAQDKAGWAKSLLVAYEHDGRLPRPSGDGTRLVALSDVTGGGLPELVEITAQGVTVWPSLGYGRFGRPLRLEGFSQAALEAAGEKDVLFNPQRIYLADTDGTGVADILAVGLKGIHVFSNRSGNDFVYKGVIPPPEGVVPGNTATLQVADIQGLGMGSLILTIPDGPLRNWVLNFSDIRPWLLDTVVDNMGGRTALSYRSSAQAWLDEKAALQASGESAVSRLPFPVHTVVSVTQTNELTGLEVGGETRYLGGVWDGEEREFAGFRCVVQRDQNQRSVANALARDASLSPPARTCTWFYTGTEGNDLAQPAFARTDIDSAFTTAPVRFTVWRDGQDIPEEPAAGSERRREAFRALRGQVRRTEVYGDDDHANRHVPYSISRQRLQVRVYDSVRPDGSPDPDNPLTLTSPAETLSFACERIAADPLVSQTMLLRQDEYGTPLDSVSVTYPRQLTPAQVDEEEEARAHYPGRPETHPAGLPAGTIKESADTQQYDCWINLTRSRVHHLTAGNDFVPGLPQDVRTDVIWWGSSHPEGNPDGRRSRDVPEGGFTADNLTVTKLLSEAESMSLTGYTKTKWRGVAGTEQNDIPTRQGLVAWTETAMLDKASLDVLRPAFEQTLGDLVSDCLNDTAGAINPDTLKRLRARGQAGITAETFFRAWNGYTARLDAVLENGYEDNAGKARTAAINALQSARRGSPVSLMTTPSWAEIKAELGVHADSGMPADKLCRAVRLYAVRVSPDDDALRALQDALFSPKHVPDLLFWRVMDDALRYEGTETDGMTPADVALYTTSAPGLSTLKNALAQPLQAESLGALLKRGGYKAMTVPHEPVVSEVWGGVHNITAYHKQAAFWVAMGVRENELLPNTALSYSPYYLCVTKATDNVTFVSTVTGMDWRFLTPVAVVDTNDNVSEAVLDALGRVSSHRFWGTESRLWQEEGSDEWLSEPYMTGYTPLAEKAFTPPATVDDALKLNDEKNVPVHEAFTLVTDSWMPLALDADGSITDKRCGVLARERQTASLLRDGKQKDALPDMMTGRTPPHIIHILTDRYDTRYTGKDGAGKDTYEPETEQQVRMTVTLHGGGQVLQTAILSPAGDALVRTEKGGLETGADGKALIKHADVRWAVTGKTEFDSKGNPVRTWLPFYLSDWRWVSDDSARDGIYADTHVYDATGREVKVLTAAGYERWTQIFPWFTAAWDENDTQEDVLARRALAEAKNTGRLH
ncbi:SpvB/TcaC N-terminal domain-containing protein [Enterobacter chuandaensis]